MASAAMVEIAEYHADVVSSLKLYFSAASPSFSRRFYGRSLNEVSGELVRRLEETDMRSAFFVLTSLEAAFRTDYEYRCRKKMKDNLSRAFRAIHKSRGTRVSLDEDIFQAWRENSTAPRLLIGDLRGAFNFRHWFAHGRYWEPRLGRKYDFNFIYSLADTVLSAFPLCPPANDMT
jgi:hypothetical protein